MPSPILVPVDFSSTSHNAAIYAAKASNELNNSEILLYHTIIATERDSPEEDLLEMAEKEMAALVAELQNIAPGTQFNSIVDNGFLLESIQTISKAHNAKFIVMGLTGKNKLEQKLIGSNTTRIALESGKPVLIIPENCSYVPIEKVVLALQLRGHLLETVPSETIINFAQLFGAHLMVLNVDDDSREFTDIEVFGGQQAAHMMFDKISASYHMLDGSDVPKVISEFATTENAQIIISIAQEHTWLGKIFRGSYTSKLAFAAGLPVLAIKENKLEN